MSHEFQREYLLRLPLPLAQLYSRAHNAKDARGRHDNTFYLFEALIKLAAIPAIAAYLAEVGQGGPRADHLDRLLARLALPSLGQWVAMLRELARYFDSRADAASHPLGRLWDQLSGSRADRPALSALYRRIKNGPDGQPGKERSCSLLQLFDALVQYRNGVFGHGAGRFEEFYEQEMGPLFLPAAHEVLAGGVLDLLGPPGTRLVHLTQRRPLDDGWVEVGLRELTGLEGERLEPLCLPAGQAELLEPDQVAVLWPGRPVPLRLDPLLVYRAGKLAEEVLFLNRERNGRHVEYLSYTTGRTERDQSTVAALAALLSRITGQEVGPLQLQQLGEQSLAEAASVEGLFGETPRAVRRGPYEILGELGRGGMGVVYLARQLSLGRLVALKTLPADLAGDEVALARFRREVHALGRCEHPNIVKVLASGAMPDGQPFYTMEFVPGCDLERVWRELADGPRETSADRLSDGSWDEAVQSASRKHREELARRAAGKAGDGASGPLPEAVPLLPPLPARPALAGTAGGYTQRVARLVRDAAAALQAVHDRQVIHRDVKPGNLMLTADGTRVVLMDFGLAKMASQGGSLTQPGGFLGTLRYAAPEQLAASTQPIGPSADVRGMGVVLWELLTRRRLFAETRDEEQLTRMICDRDVPQLRALDASFDRDLEAIVARATERRASERIPTAARLSEYLQLYLEGEPLPIRPPGAGEMVWRWVRAHKPLVVSAVTALLIALVSAVTAFVSITRSRDLTIQALGEKSRALEHSRRTLKVAQLERVAQLWEQDPGQARDLLEDTGRCPLDLRDFAWGYYYRLCARDRATLISDAVPVTALALAADGKTLASGSAGGSVTLWDVSGGQPLRILSGHAGPVSALTFRADGRALASGCVGAGPAARVGLTALAQPTLDETLGFGSRTTAPLGRASADPGGVKLWDLATGKPSDPLATGGRRRWAAMPLVLIRDLLAAGSRRISSVAFSPDGGMLAAGDLDGTMTLRDLRASKEVARLWAREDGIWAVAFSPDGRTLAAGCGSGTVMLWDVPAARLRTRLPGHAGGVRYVVFAPDGRTLASAGEDGAVRLWDMPDGKARRALKGHAEPVRALAFTADGSALASGGGADRSSMDSAIRIWEVATGSERMRLTGHSAAITGLGFGPDGRTLASGSWDGTVKLWDLAVSPWRSPLQAGSSPLALSADGRAIALRDGDRRVAIREVARGRQQAVLEHPEAVLCAAFTPDGTTVATASGTPGKSRSEWSGSTVRLWDSATGRESASFPRLTEKITLLMFSPDGQTLAAIVELAHHQGELLRLWDRTGQELPLSERVRGKLLAFSPDGRTLAALQDSPFHSWVRLIDLPTRRVRLTLEERRGLTALAFAPDGKTLALAEGDEQPAVQLWDAVTGTKGLRLLGHREKSQVTALAFTPGGRALASASSDGTVKLWDPEIGQACGTLAHGDPISGLAFAADGQTLISAGADGTVKLWEATVPPYYATLKGHAEYVTSVAFSPDGRTLASGCTDRVIRLWDTSTGQQRAALGEHDGWVNSVAFAPDGRTLASAGYEGTVKLWDLSSGRERASLQHERSVWAVAFTADGTTLATACGLFEPLKGGWFSTEVWVWNVRTGKVRTVLHGHTQAVLSVAFSPDGRTLASGSTDGTVKLWDMPGGGERRTLRGPPGRITSVAFTPDGRALAAGGLTADPQRGGKPAGLVQLWDVATGEALAPLRGHPGEVDAVAFAPDGRLLASGSVDHTVRLWDWAAAKELATLYGHERAVKTVAFHPDGTALASGSGGAFWMLNGRGAGTVKLWRLPPQARR